MTLQTVDFNLLKTKPKDLVLDVGCGEGRHSIHAALELNGVKVIALDANIDDLKTTQNKLRATQELLNKPTKTITCIQGDICNLPFASNQFDKIICSEVLEHIVPYNEALSELKRILKPGGHIAISVPRYLPEYICWKLSEDYHQVEGGHVRIFKAHKLKQQCKEHNLCLYAEHWSHALHTPYWWLKCLWWNKEPTPKLLKSYHDMLVWDLMEKPQITRFIESILNPFLGKSIVLYFVKSH